MFEMLDERKQQEIEFHDRLRETNIAQRWSPELEKEISKNPLWANMKYYAVERRNLDFVRTWLQENCAGARVLDYCCGNGDDSFKILSATNAEKVVGIDISPISIENCRKQAAERGVSSRCEFHVMDAEDMTFDDNEFDIVNIYGVLHHLEFDSAMAELARVIKPGGKVIATEALRHNPIIHMYRKMTPGLRTSWEVDHILGRKKIAQAAKYFENVRCEFFELATLLAVPFRKTMLFGPILSALEKGDDVLLRLPGVRWLAWKAVIIFSNPRSD